MDIILLVFLGWIALSASAIAGGLGKLYEHHSKFAPEAGPDGETVTVGDALILVSSGVEQVVKITRLVRARDGKLYASVES